MSSRTLSQVVLCLFLTGCVASDGTGPSFSPASKLAINANEASLSRGASTTVTATLTGFTSGDAVTWSSSNAAIAVVTPTGDRTATVLANDLGIADITAKLGNQSATIRMTVTLFPKVDGTSASFIYGESEGVQMIPLPAGAKGVEAFAINDQGRVVGRIAFASTEHAFIWSHDEGMMDLGELYPGGRTRATSVSQDGKVAGWGMAPDGHVHGFSWTRGLGMRDLGTPQAEFNSYATGINSNGQVVGYAESLTTQVRAFVWTEDRGFQFLPTSGIPAEATAINDAGEISGALAAGDDEDYGYYFIGAVMWTAAGTQTSLFKCGQSCASAALALSGNGSVVGWDQGNAFIWSRASGERSVPGTENAAWSNARGVNDLGSVVGSVTYSVSYGQRYQDVSAGFVSTVAHGYHELFPPAGRSTITLTGINNRDQTVGYIQ